MTPDGLTVIGNDSLEGFISGADGVLRYLDWHPKSFVGISENGLVLLANGQGFGSLNVALMVWLTNQTSIVMRLDPLSLGSQSFGQALSGDGSVAVGYNMEPNGRQTAVKWTSNGIQGLGTLPGGTNSQALAVSRDGAVIAGYGKDGNGTVHPILWMADGGVKDLGFAGSAQAITPDGSKIAGSTKTPSGGVLVWAWDAAIGLREAYNQFGFAQVLPACI